MEANLVEKIKNNPKFNELVTKRSSFAWKLSIAMLAVYYSFILVVAFNKDVLAAPLGEGVMTVGMPVGIAIILFAFAITGIYVKRANTEFDDLTNDIKREARVED